VLIRFNKTPKPIVGLFLALAFLTPAVGQLAFPTGYGGGLNQSGAVVVNQVPDNPSSPTVDGHLAKINTTAGYVSATSPTTSDVGVPIYIVVSHGWNGLGPSFAIGGTAACVMDSAGGTSNHYVGASNVSSGLCMDLGSYIPQGVCSVGTLTNNPSGGANGAIAVNPQCPGVGVPQGWTVSGGGASQVVTAPGTIAAQGINAPNITGLTGNLGLNNINMLPLAPQGTGMFVMAGTRFDTGCIMYFVSDDVNHVRPLFWPMDPLTCSFPPPSDGAGLGAGGTGAAEPFLAPWNNTHYLAYQGGGASQGTYPLYSSTDTISWTFVTKIPSLGGTSYGVVGGSWLYDDVTGCPAQDWSCLHFIGAGQTSASGANQYTFEVHPTNSSLTSWSTPVRLGPFTWDDPTSWDPLVFKYNADGYYYLLHDEISRTSYILNYFLYRSTSLTGTYSLVSSTPYTGAADTTGCHIATGHGCEGGVIVQSDSGKWMFIFHDDQDTSGEYFMTNSNPTSVSSGWSAPTLISGTNDWAVARLKAFRTSDVRTMYLAAAQARQTAFPFEYRRGFADCASQGLVKTTGVNGGNCYGMEVVTPAQQGTYEALRFFTSGALGSVGDPCGDVNPYQGDCRHMDFGYYTSATAFTNFLQMSDHGGAIFSLPVKAQGFTLNNLLASNAAPTISSGFGVSPSITVNNGTAAFRINVGTGGTASSGVIGLPTATNGWNCFAGDVTTPGSNNTRQSATTATTATLTNYGTSGTTSPWPASDVLSVSCFAY
jgi:hypothetical protein